MRLLLLISFWILALQSTSVASLSKSVWEKVELPGVDAFYANAGGNEYLTVVKNQSTEKMNFAGQSDAEVAHVLTLLRRVSLSPFGITDWKISSLTRTTSKTNELVRIEGTYLSKKSQQVHFFENIYLNKLKFTQFTWTQTGVQTLLRPTIVQGYFHNLENDYL